ncbi:MAG TPA: hydroxyisourate hydrolase [Acidobacteriaceae bacterium]
MGLSTHILDTALGRPATGVSLTLAKQNGHGWSDIGNGTTDADGRCKTLLGDKSLEKATYRIRFATAEYFAAQNLTGLYPYVDIAFTVADPGQHYHIPLLLTANGYSTYRGS